MYDCLAHVFVSFVGSFLPLRITASVVSGKARLVAKAHDQIWLESVAAN